MPPDDELTPETPEVEPVDSGEEAGTTTTPDAETQDWEKMFKDTQSAYTQSQQELSEYRDYMEKLQTDEEERRALLNELADEFGIALPGEPDDDYQDPGELAYKELQELKAQQKQAQEQYEQEQQWEQERDRFHDALSDYQKDNDIQFTEDEVNFAGARIILEGADPKEVFTALDRLGQARYERIVASKKAPRAPSGVQGSPSLDLSNREEVEQAAQAAAQEAFSAE